MTVFLALIFLICLWKIKFAKPLMSGINENYLDIKRTDSMKGIFILLVFLSHARNCISTLPSYISDPVNSVYDVFQNHLGQGVVVMFLFYSGYGVMEQIKKKGNGYISTVPKIRIAKTLFNFDIAVIFFIIIDMCLGTLKNYSLPHVLLAFTGWESVGNSNWYIFDIIVMYLLTYIAFKVFKSNYKKALTVVTAFTVLFIAALALLKDSWWFDTILLYPLGMWFSVCKDKIEAFFKKKTVHYYILLAAVAVIFVVSHILRQNIFCYEVSQVALCALIVCVTLKIDIYNKALRFFGAHLFEIYILMRIPMLILLHFDVTNTYLFVIISFVSTVILAVLFKKLLSFLNGKIFYKKQP